MINCKRIAFSEHYCCQRIKTAYKVIGEKTVKKLISFALYLLGASRKAAAEWTDIPYDTFKSVTDRIEREGISSLFDRRSKIHGVAAKERDDVVKARVEVKEDSLVFDLGTGTPVLRIKNDNILQKKTVLLTFHQSNLIDTNTVAALLEYTPVHVQRLSRQLNKDDVSILTDQRHGQKKDYVFDQQTKAELTQQFIANTVCGRKTSGQALSEDLKQRCNLELSSRSILFHLHKSGLQQIKYSLPELITALKKTTCSNSE